MFKGLLKTLGEWLEARAFESELKHQLVYDAWLRQTYISINLYLNSDDYAKNNLASHVIQTQMTNEFRRTVSRAAGLRLLEISKSRNKILECRSWIIDVIGEYASLRALFTQAATHASEVASGIRHESTDGLFESFYLYAPKVYAQYFPSKVYQGTEQNNEELRHLSIAYQFWIDIGNIARIGLNDQGDWFRKYFGICVAIAEANLKPDKGYLVAILSDEREALRQELLFEHRHV